MTIAWEWILFAGTAVAVSVGCLVPNRWLPPLPNDKLMHGVAFGGLALMAMHLAKDRTEAALWLLGLLIGGWLIECLQQLLPDRHFCWRDIAANAAGIATVTVLALLYSAW